MGNFIDAVSRAWAHRKLAKGQCAQCRAILPDAGAPHDFNTCSPECALELWASITA